MPRIRGRPLRVAIALTLAAGLLAIVGPTVSAGAPIWDPGISAGIKPASCQCGGPPGAASLAHISPWANADCATSIGLSNISSVDVYLVRNGALQVAYAGWAEWRYSSNGSCHGYQWLRYHLNMNVVRASTVANGWTSQMWFTQDYLDWTTYTTTFSGRDADGTFDTYAILAGPLTTTGGITTSLAMFWDSGHSPPTNFTA